MDKIDQLVAIMNKVEPLKTQQKDKKQEALDQLLKSEEKEIHRHGKIFAVTTPKTRPALNYKNLKIFYNQYVEEIGGDDFDVEDFIIFIKECRKKASVVKAPLLKITNDSSSE